MCVFSLFACFYTVKLVTILGTSGNGIVFLWFVMAVKGVVDMFLSIL